MQVLIHRIWVIPSKDQGCGFPWIVLSIDPIFLGHPSTYRLLCSSDLRVHQLGSTSTRGFCIQGSPWLIQAGMVLCFFFQFAMTHGFCRGLGWWFTIPQSSRYLLRRLFRYVLGVSMPPHKVFGSLGIALQNQRRKGT